MIDDWYDNGTLDWPHGCAALGGIGETRVASMHKRFKTHAAFEE